MMRKQSKAELEKKKTAIRASRITLFVLMVFEAIILLMHFPGFLGVKWLETALVAMRTFLVSILWPASAADMGTYRGTIYEICTWFQKLPVYELLVQVIIYLVPGLFVLTFVRIRILNWRIKRLDNPEAQPLLRHRRQPQAPKQPKPPKEPKTQKDGKLREWMTESGLTPQEAKEADDYCQMHRDRCDDPFSEDPGLRIQRPTGELGFGESRDYVQPWDENGEIDLTAVLGRPVKVKLEHGKPYTYSKRADGNITRSPSAMRRNDPMGVSVADIEGRPVICVITWLGG